MENDMPNWAPTTYEQCIIKYQHHEGESKPLTGETLAEWNLAWLLDYKSMSKLDGTIAGNMAHHKLCNPTLSAAITADVKDNTYKIKDLAETVGPVEFINTYMRRPYQYSWIANQCGEEVFIEAKVSAEKLAQGMASRVDAAQGEAKKAIQTAKIMAFKRKA